MVDQMDDHDPDLARFTNDAGSDGEAEDPFFSHLGELFFCVVDVVAQDDMVCLHFVVEISTLSIWCCPHITCYVCLHWGHEHESNKTIFALRFAVHGSKTWPLKTGDDVRCRWPSSCHRHFGSCVARFQSVLKSQRVAFLRVNSIPMRCLWFFGNDWAHVMFELARVFRFVGHKGHNSKGCNLSTAVGCITSWGDCIEKCKQTGKPMTQLRSKQQRLKRCKFHRISTPSKPKSNPQKTSNKGFKTSMLLYMARSCLDLSKDWSENLQGELPHKSNLQEDEDMPTQKGKWET